MCTEGTKKGEQTREGKKQKVYYNMSCINYIMFIFGLLDVTVSFVK